MPSSSNTEPPDPVGPRLQRLSGLEVALLEYYRACCPVHQQQIRWFAATARSRCEADSEGQVIPYPLVR